MRNTLISLDMMFINAAKEIVTIHRNTTKLSDQTYPSSKPAMYVVEVVADLLKGTTFRLGIELIGSEIKTNF